MDSNQNSVFILLTTENGNGYSDPLTQKIVFIAYDQETKKDIEYVLQLIDSKKFEKNKQYLNFNIRDYDLSIMNFDYLGKYEEMINYTHTKIFSVDANNEQELSYIMKCLYEKMKNNNMIKQILYSRRRKHVGDKKCIFFLIKIFIDIKCENTIIKKEISN